jgi:hypothetical protein
VSAYTDERLRAAYAHLVRDRAPADRAGCVSPEDLLAVVERAGSDDERLRTLDHVMSCAPCRRDFDLLRASTQAAIATAPRVHWSRQPQFRVFALAASLVLAVALGMYVRSSGDDAGGVVRGGAFALNPARVLPDGGTLLSWRPVNVANARYQLTVLDDAGRSVVQTTVRDTMFVLADSLSTGRQLVWSVSAILADGTTLGTLAAPLAPRR